MPDATSLRAALRIAPLALADLPAYKALRDRMLAAHPHAFTSDAAAEAIKPASVYSSRLGYERQEGGHFTIGAWRGARLVGAISCERDTRLKVRHVAQVVGMMVRDEAQGHGIGRALLDACIERARRADGLEMLTLSVTAGNDAAQRLYRAAGFTRYGTLPRAVKLGGRYHDKDLMVLYL
ncbi:MAG TPA: GNAT family N-acetyltransferase [Ideonella sp.]|nr:GNAT family N-acetyltransferase [Ideonella sp.]